MDERERERLEKDKERLERDIKGLEKVAYGSNLKTLEMKKRALKLIEDRLGCE